MVFDKEVNSMSCPPDGWICKVLPLAFWATYLICHNSLNKFHIELLYLLVTYGNLNKKKKEKTWIKIFGFIAPLTLYGPLVIT